MKSIKEVLNLMVIAIAVVLGVLFFSKPNPNSELHSSSLAKPEIDIDSNINRYMQEVQREKTSAELRSISRLQKNANLINRPRAGIDETDPSTIPRERQIWKDEDSQAAQAGDQMDLIYRRIYEEEVAKRLTEQEKKDYAIEFIENARRSGYHIQLSMDMEVISVEPIRNPQNDYDSLDQKN